MQKQEGYIEKGSGRLTENLTEKEWGSNRSSGEKRQMIVTVQPLLPLPTPFVQGVHRRVLLASQQQLQRGSGNGRSSLSDIQIMLKAKIRIKKRQACEQRPGKETEQDPAKRTGRVAWPINQRMTRVSWRTKTMEPQLEKERNCSVGLTSRHTLPLNVLF